MSIITPNFNGERFIRRVVESVCQQNYSVEHIIVDDCSTDGSWALLEELSQDYSWLKPIRLEKNAGPVVARNRAIELAQGRFLAFLDVDDFWLPHKLHRYQGARTFLYWIENVRGSDSVVKAATRQFFALAFDNDRP